MILASPVVSSILNGFGCRLGCYVSDGVSLMSSSCALCTAFVAIFWKHLILLAFTGSVLVYFSISLIYVVDFQMSVM